MSHNSINNPLNDNLNDEEQVIEGMTKTLEALLANPNDQEAWEQARFYVKSMRE